jgi:hypothetical protein
MNRKLFKEFIQKLFKKKYKYRNVDDIPSKLESDIIYIVQEGTEPETLAFMCPCGCTEPVYLNLLKDTSPYWSYKIEKRKISIFPSVVRRKGCRSHYCIRRGYIVWV